MSETTTFTATVRKANPVLVGLASLPLAAIPVLLLLAVLVAPAFAAPTFHLALLGSIALAYIYKRKPMAAKKAVQVRVEPDAVFVGDQRIERSSIQRGDLLDNGEVRLCRTREREVELNLGSDTKARELLRALELDVSQTVGKFRAMSRVMTSMFRQLAVMFGVMLPTMLVTFIGASLLGSPIATAVMPLSMIAMVVFFLVPSFIEVGGDGVLMKWLGRERFVPHADIVHVYSTVDGFGRGKRAMVKIGLTDGKEIRIPVGTPAWGGEAKADALATRIHEAREAYERGAVAPEVLRRDEAMPLGTWVKRLRNRVVSHREAVIPLERFWHVIEDAAADPLERAAATVALGAGLQNADRERLARVAKRTAAPKLRVVLETAPDVEEEELVELLREVSETEKKKSA